MEFQKERVYTSLNADELKAGDKVIVSYTLADLKEQIKSGDSSFVEKIIMIKSDDYPDRFQASDGLFYALAYLVERAENCTMCDRYCTDTCAYVKGKDPKCTICYQGFTPTLAHLSSTKTTEKKYRPFRDTDELIKVWLEKGSKWQKREITMPFIWVRRKEGNIKGQLITEFSNSLWVEMGKEGYNMTDLLVHFTFLDGSTCGVEE